MATNTVKKRDLFGELMEGVSAMQAQREGRITLRSHQVERLSLPPIDQQIIRSTRERLQMSRPAFTYDTPGSSPRTAHRPNRSAAC